MSGSTSRTLTGAYYSLTLSTPCISFAVDPATGRSGEMEYHREAAVRIERALAAVRDPIDRALPALAPLVPYDGRLPVVHDFLRREFLEAGDRPCALEFIVPAPECAILRVCFRSLPDANAVEVLRQALRECFAGLPWPD